MGGKESHPGSIWPMIGDKRGTDTFAPLDEDQMVQLKKLMKVIKGNGTG